MATAQLADIAAALDVKVTGRHGPRKDFPLAARKLPDGRWLVVSGNCDEPLFQTKKLALISRLGQTFSGMFEEHVMTSGFAAWGNGRKTWSLLHKGDNEPLHLKSTGKLPRDVADLKDAATEKQRHQGNDAEGDYLYELVIDLVLPHAGLDPDVDFDDGEFEELGLGFWRETWRRTFWWRFAFVIVAGGLAFIFAMKWLGKLLFWILGSLGLH